MSKLKLVLGADDVAALRIGAEQLLHLSREKYGDRGIQADHDRAQRVRDIADNLEKAIQNKLPIELEPTVS